MKIGLNATCINDRPSGAKQRFIGIYTEIVKRLPDVEFVIYEPSDCQMGGWFDGVPNVDMRHTTLPSEGRIRRFLAGLGYWERTLRADQFDLFEGFNQPLIKAPTGRTLLTIHDIRRMHSEWGGLEHLVYKVALERALNSADHVIAVSESMKNEIHGFFPNVPISVIYNGLNAADFDALTDEQVDAVRRKYGFAQEFLLTVGHFEKRKNYLRLVDAVALLRDRGRACRLVIIGNDSGEGHAIRSRVEATNLSDHVQILSGLSDHEVRCVYKLCTLFVFPSSYEGFGIPVLEAMAAKRPMVLSDISVFSEITQQQGVYFPRNDVQAMAESIDRVLSSDTEQARLVAYGVERVRAFSFPSLAGRLARLYAELT